MWGWLYISLLALAAGATYFGVVVHATPRADDRMVVLPSVVAFLCWFWLALTPEIVLASGGATSVISIGSERWLFAVNSLLVGIWIIGVAIGIFPERRAETEIEREVLTRQ